jgi:hypothetical protein
MIYENPVGHGTHCMQPVEWVGRWKFLKGWTKVWERHADELVGARRVADAPRLPGLTAAIERTPWYVASRRFTMTTEAP